MIKMLEIQAGIFDRKAIRNFLKTAEFKGYNIEWIENKHFATSTFKVKGKLETLKLIYKTINQQIIERKGE